MTDNNNKSTLKEAFDAELMKRLEENPPEIPTYEEFSAMVDKSLAERCRRRKRIAGIAAGFVVVLLAGILACTNLTADVDADKNPKEEITTEDGVIIEDGGWGSSDSDVWTITEWERVPDVKKVYPEFLIPEYIPEGYEFERLTVETVETGATTCEYIFSALGNDGMIEIEEFIPIGTMAFDINNVSRTLQCKEGTIYIQERENKATMQKDDGIMLSVWASVSDKEYIKIIENMKN